MPEELYIFAINFFIHKKCPFLQQEMVLKERGQQHFDDGDESHYTKMVCRV